MTLTTRVLGRVVCMTCGVHVDLPETGTSYTKTWDGRDQLHLGLSVEALAVRAGYRRVVVDSCDPVEYGHAYDGYVCKTCHGRLLDFLRREREKNGAGDVPT